MMNKLSQKQRQHHKVQCLNLEQVVIGFDLRKQKLFGPGQTYTTLSRIKTYDNLYCIG